MRKGLRVSFTEVLQKNLKCALKILIAQIMVNMYGGQIQI